jgi:Photoprotection regulator fluorescence recovery protein
MSSSQWFRDEAKWSPAEKKLAREAFERAYQRKCAALLAEVKGMIARDSSPSVIWKLHDFLSRERKTVDKKFDYRYSVLLDVFGTLLREGWLKEEDLAGLAGDKIEGIKHWASL